MSIKQTLLNGRHPLLPNCKIYVEFVKDRLELREKGKLLSLIKADLVPNLADEAEKISRAKYVPISRFLGLFLNLDYITDRYCRKLSKKQYSPAVLQTQITVKPDYLNNGIGRLFS